MDGRKHMMYLFVGDTSSLNAEKWTKSALATLRKHLVVSSLFNRDFEVEFGSEGETVHAHRLGKFVGGRLVEGNAVNVETASATGVDVKLNQHIVQAFRIKDRDQRRSFKDLVKTYIVPSAIAMVEQIDLVAAGERWQFWKNQWAIPSATDYAAVVEMNRVMTENLCPRMGRYLVGGPRFEADVLLEPKFTEAQMTGDGSPISNGIVARGSNFTFATTHNLTDTTGAGRPTTTATINAGNLAKGATVLTVDACSPATGPEVGGFLKINAFIYRVVSDTVSTATGTITIESPGLYEAISDNDTVTIVTPGLVNLGAGYIAGWGDWIVVDGTAFTSGRFPVIGDGVSINGVEYGIYDADEGNTKIMLNRPLDVAIADNDFVCPFPDGNYNFALTPGASTIVVRPMELPEGENAGFANAEGFGLRGVMSYSHLGAVPFARSFSYDTLVGVKTTDVDQGGLLINN